VCLQSALTAAINGGNRVVGAGNVVLDASPSFDPDVSSSDGLLFSWMCIRGGSLYGQSCAVSLAAIATQALALTDAGMYVPGGAGPTPIP
jgi:hypothetical protein